MKRDRIILAGLIGVMLVGCMSNQELKDWGKRTGEARKEKDREREEARNRKLDVQFDPYAGGYILRGRYLSRNRFPNITEMRLIAGFDKNGEGEFYKLYVHHMSQTGWKMLESASDIDATPLTVQKVNRELSAINSDALHEHVQIALTRDYLERNKTKGLDIRIAGERGFVIVKIDAAYIQGFLDGFDTEQAAIKASHS